MIVSLLFLALSNVCVCAMSLFRKQYEKVSGAKFLSVLVFLCATSLFICAGAFAFLGARIVVNKLAFLLAFVLSLISILGVITSLVGLQYGNMSILMIFVRMGGIVLSCLYGLLFDAKNNPLNVWKIIGFVLVAVILLLSFVRTKQEKSDATEQTAKRQLIFAFLCILIFFNGLALPVMSVQTQYNPEYRALDFTFLYILFQFLGCSLAFAVIYLVRKNKREMNQDIKNCITGKGIWCLLGYAVVCFASEYLALICTNTLPIIVQAPLSFTLSVVLIAVMDFLIYRERLDKKQLWQIGLSILTSVCFVI